MKTSALFVLVILGLVAFLHWRDWSESQGADGDSKARNGSANSTPTSSESDRTVSRRAGVSEEAQPVTYEPEDAREFNVTIEQIIPGVGALAQGGFYRLNALPPPGYRSPLEGRPGEQRRAEETRGWTQSGDIFITGIPNGYADGEQFHGWLVRTGAKTLNMDDGKHRTVPAFHVVAKPPSADATPKPGEWMYRNRGRILDRPER
jgi:hypothetical protein